MNSTRTYASLTNSSLEFPLNFKFPSDYNPSPTKQDYKKGFIRRSFCLYISSGKIVEIPSKKINIYQKNYFLKTRIIKWKISGPERNVYKNNILFDEGVYEYNMKILENLKKSGFENIKTFLHPLDLYKK